MTSLFIFTLFDFEQNGNCKVDDRLMQTMVFPASVWGDLGVLFATANALCAFFNVSKYLSTVIVKINLTERQKLSVQERSELEMKRKHLIRYLAGHWGVALWFASRNMKKTLQRVHFTVPLWWYLPDYIKEHVNFTQYLIFHSFILLKNCFSLPKYIISLRWFLTYLKQALR